MMDDAIETFRRTLVERLTARSDTAWTVTANRFVVRRSGRVLCKVGRDGERLLVEFMVPRTGAPDVDRADFVQSGSPSAAEQEESSGRWRRAHVTSAEQLEAVWGWILPD